MPIIKLCGSVVKTKLTLFVPRKTFKRLRFRISLEDFRLDFQSERFLKTHIHRNNKFIIV
jgi:hypothetical protein